MNYLLVKKYKVWKLYWNLRELRLHLVDLHVNDRKRSGIRAPEVDTFLLDFFYFGSQLTCMLCVSVQSVFKRCIPKIFFCLQLLISAFFGLAAAAGFNNQYPEQSNRPQAAYERNARILALDADVKEDSFRYNYETENGIKAEEQGREVSTASDKQCPINGHCNN